MTDLAHLQIRVESLEAANAEKRLDQLEKTGKKAEKATGGLTDAFKKLIVPLVSVATATAGLTKLVSVARQFDVLNAQLKTATGSSEKAAQAFEAIQDFASATPYDLQQVTTAFTKLVNLGLDPSEKALTSYGNTASAMGKDLDQLIEAVADAATGEFERLKEFGIKASQEGDKVRFTFRGVTTTVGKNAAEIEGYLQALGENEFAGAMAERVMTLDGALSNLGDEWNKLFLAIARDTPIGDYIEATVRKGIKALEQLRKLITDISTTTLEELIAQYDATAVTLGNAAARHDKRVIQTATKTFRTLRAELEAYTADEIDFARTRNQIATLEEQIANSTVKSKRRESAKAFKERKAQAEADRALLQAELEQLKLRNSELAQTLQLKGSKIPGLGASAGDAFVGPPEPKDRLAEFKTGGKGVDTKAVDKLRESLRTEEEVLLESYNNRRKIILDNTEANSEARKTLLERLNKEFKDEALGELAAPDTYQEEFDRLVEYFERRRELIRANTELEQSERKALETELTEERIKRLDELEQQRIKMVYGHSAELFSGLASLSKGFAGDQNKTYKLLFAASKAFAISQAIVDIQAGIASAWKLGWPAGLGAAASVVSSTAGILSTIQGTNYAGAFDRGGFIGSGQVGLVGEVGPELVQGPARVVGRQQTVSMLQEASNQQNQANTPVNVINVIDPSVMHNYVNSSTGTDAIINIIRDNPDIVRSIANA